MEDGAAFGVTELIVRHRRIGCAEIDRLILNALDPAAGAHGLVVDLDLR